ncbi:MAG: hypothetical protein AVDCRST_MAG76-1262, partial [uncultured Acidimicrobiales bacterium]
CRRRPGGTGLGWGPALARRRRRRVDRRLDPLGRGRRGRRRVRAARRRALGRLGRRPGRRGVSH